MSRTNDSNPISPMHPSGERRAELERIRDATWPPNESPDARKARIARNLAAIDGLPKWNLKPEVLKGILEDPDNEYFES